MSFSSLLNKYKQFKPSDATTERNQQDEHTNLRVGKKRKADEVGSSSDENPCEIINQSTTLQGDFAKIGCKHRTDKVTHHGYHRFYGRFLEQFRSLSSDFAMVEIGVENSYSLQTWLEYFPNMFIYGIDINLSKKGERYEILQCDQSNLQDMRSLVETRIKPNHDKVAFIIDDGSHIPEHQLLCFDYLFEELLLPGGVYIIEDVETSYWSTGSLYGYKTKYGYHHEKSLIEICKHLVDDINFEFVRSDKRRIQNDLLRDIISDRTRKLISSMTFGQNCVIFYKKTKEESEHYDNRHYRFSQHL